MVSTVWWNRRHWAKAKVVSNDGNRTIDYTAEDSEAMRSWRGWKKASTETDDIVKKNKFVLKRHDTFRKQASTFLSLLQWQII